MIAQEPIAYWQGITGKRILIIGPLPPPLGGVAIHVARVADYFMQHGNQVAVHHSEPAGRTTLWWLYQARLARKIALLQPELVYYHGSYLPTSDRELTLLAQLKKLYPFQLIIIEHDCRHIYQRSLRYTSWYRQFIQQEVKEVVAIGDKTMNSYTLYALAQDRFYYGHAFLAPAHTFEQAEQFMHLYPESFWRWRIRQQKVCLMNAAACIRYGATDLYGIRDAITTIIPMRQQEEIALCIVLATIADHEYLHYLYTIASHAESAIFFLIGNYPLWPLLAHADYFLRPTYSDGDSISIREALWANIPTIASNVCRRPNGVITYDPYEPDELRNCLSNR